MKLYRILSSVDYRVYCLDAIAVQSQKGDKPTRLCFHCVCLASELILQALCLSFCAQGKPMHTDHSWMDGWTDGRRGRREFIQTGR